MKNNKKISPLVLVVPAVIIVAISFFMVRSNNRRVVVQPQPTVSNATQSVTNIPEPWGSRIPEIKAFLISNLPLYAQATWSTESKWLFTKEPLNSAILEEHFGDVTGDGVPEMMIESSAVSGGDSYVVLTFNNGKIDFLKIKDSTGIHAIYGSNFDVVTHTKGQTNHKGGEIYLADINTIIVNNYDTLTLPSVFTQEQFDTVCNIKVWVWNPRKQYSEESTTLESRLKSRYCMWGESFNK